LRLAGQSALLPSYRHALYKARRCFGLSASRPALAVIGAILIGIGGGGCSLSRPNGAFAGIDDRDTTTGSIGPAQASPAVPTENDLAFARNAASDVLTRGDKDASQPWENPETGARGSVTPLARAYSSDGRLCRDFLASYVNGASESWLHGAACQSDTGQWEIHTLKPWKRG